MATSGEISNSLYGRVYLVRPGHVRMDGMGFGNRKRCRPALELWPASPRRIHVEHLMAYHVWH